MNSTQLLPHGVATESRLANSVLVDVILDVGRSASPVKHRSEHCIERHIATWLAVTGRSLPSRGDAVEQFRHSLESIPEADARIREEMFSCIISPLDGESVAEWVSACARRLHARVHHWYPLWVGAAWFALDWCRDNGYRDLVFVARDALPFHTAARTLQAGGDCGAVEIHVGHSFRDDEGRRQLLFPTGILREPRLAVLDSGCYGSVAAEVLRGRSREDTAVLHFVSRNPSIFGYLNQLNAARALDPSLDSGRVRDFAVFAIDTVEALPKPYRLERLPNGSVQAVVLDLLSFVLGLSVLEEVAVLSRQPPDFSELQAHADDLCRRYCKGEELGLFDSPIPAQAPPQSDLHGIEIHPVLPQRNLF
ncbi:hypothetical protein [Streptomyces sp. NPDC048527]|uniref:hypothetical protein n=1 Tax=Streptomyces sp. NPDC048527 TaxID=3365568 RepID=UPI00371BF5B3